MRSWQRRPAIKEPVLLDWFNNNRSSVCALRGVCAPYRGCLFVVSVRLFSTLRLLCPTRELRVCESAGVPTAAVFSDRLQLHGLRAASPSMAVFVWRD